MDEQIDLVYFASRLEAIAGSKLSSLSCWTSLNLYSAGSPRHSKTHKKGSLKSPGPVATLVRRFFGFQRALLPANGTSNLLAMAFQVLRGKVRHLGVQPGCYQKLQSVHTRPTGWKMMKMVSFRLALRWRGNCPGPFPACLSWVVYATFRKNAGAEIQFLLNLAST